MMNRFQKGSLVRLINEDGIDAGLVIYVDLLPPGFLPSDGRCYDGFWHFKIIDVKGEMKYLSTHNWTLVPVEPDSCNP